MKNRSFVTEARAMSAVIQSFYTEKEFLTTTLKGLDETAEIAIKKKAQLQMVEHLIRMYEA